MLRRGWTKLRVKKRQPSRVLVEEWQKPTRNVTQRKINIPRRKIKIPRFFRRRTLKSTVQKKPDNFSLKQPEYAPKPPQQQTSHLSRHWKKYGVGGVALGVYAGGVRSGFSIANYDPQQRAETRKMYRMQKRANRKIQQIVQQSLYENGIETR